MLTQFATAASLGLLALSHSATQAAWMYWIYMSAQYMIEPGIYSLLMDRIPSVASTMGASASTFFVSSSAQVAASAAAGAALARFGYSPVLAVIAALAVIAGHSLSPLARYRDSARC